MKRFIGFEKGMGIGGWLTNYKRFNCIPQEKRMILTIGDYEHFENYITEKDIAYIASLGMDHIRLGFDQIVLEESPYHYSERTFKCVDNFINWCEKYNLNIVLNLHKAIGNYCDIKESIVLFDNTELQKRFISFWCFIEKRYSNKPNIAFELLNEVRNIEPEKWNNLAQDTLKKIRLLNNTRKIIIGSTSFNNPSLLLKLKVFEDENIIYTFHMYAPMSFTHQRAVLFGNYCFYNRDMPYPGDIQRYRDFEKANEGSPEIYSKYTMMDKNYLYDSLNGAVKFIEKYPSKILWCGEFGTIRHANITWRENWMKDVITFLKQNKITYCVWNYLSTPNDGNRFSLVDDDNRKILSSNMAKIIRGDFD